MKELLRRNFLFRKFFIVFIGCFFLITGETLRAQVAGVSASKLTAVDGTLVPFHKLEAEPSYGYLYSKKSFDEKGHLYPISPDQDSAVLLKDFFFRFTYGAGKRLEIGTMVTANLGYVSFGAKYRFVEHKNFLAVALLGFNFTNQSDYGLRRTGFFGKYMSIASGVALTTVFSPRFSLDISAEYQNTFSYKTSISDDYFMDSDLGYYFFHHTFQVVGGFSFQYNHFKQDEPDDFRLSFHPGVTVETGKSFIIVFYTPIDLIGRNQGRFTGFSFAFTFSVL